LASEGLIRTSGILGRPKRWFASGWTQAAAAIVLFLGGAALGSGVGARQAPSDLADSGPATNLELVPVGTGTQPVSSLADAAQLVNQAEQDYMLALLQYGQILRAQEGPASMGDPTKRLAAIEAILAASSAAMEHAPADPFVNGVLVSAVAEKEGILRNASLTAGSGIF
jgi:hypothetical protein